MAAVATLGPVWNKRVTLTASGANQGRGLALVQGASDIAVAVASVANSIVVGIQEEATVNAGDPVSVVQLGDAIAIAGAAVNAGQYVKNDATGKLIPITGTAGDGENIVGRAQSSAAASGDEFLLLLIPSVN